MSDISDKIKEYLKKEGLSVVQFAKKTGIPQDRIYSWIRKRGNPKSEDQKILDTVFEFGINTKPQTVNEQPIPHTKKPDSKEPGDDISSKYIALLERQEARAVDIGKAAAEAAIKELMASYATKQEVSDLRTSLGDMKRQLAGNLRLIQGIQRFAVVQTAIVRGIPEQEVSDYLDSLTMELALSEKTHRKQHVDK